MSAAIPKLHRALAVIVLISVLAALACSGGPPEPKMAVPEPIDPEAASAIDIALHSLKERLAQVNIDNFPEQIVALYGPPSSIRHKIERSSDLGIRRQTTEAVLITMYIYDLYDLTSSVNSELAVHAPEAIYSRAPLAGLTPKLCFGFIDGRLHAVSDHEFF